VAAPKEILDLIERFERNLDAYKTGQYNETQLRREFLDPFFKHLGWDIDNTAGYAEPYKDVIHEDQIRLAGAAKAPDYSFRIGGARKFFLEAKKPSIYIKGDPSPAYQLRRYAWTQSLPLSILSDFEEFAVYDGRFKPFNGDDASKARVFYCTFKEYPEKWDWIASIFSRDAILKGSFDKYAEQNKNKRGTTDVDEDFLATIETWRKELAQNLALRNPALSQRELNFAVQRIIDRIIFLRICEDRAIEDYGRLKALINGGRIYRRLCEIFEEADTRYNSGLFHFHREKGRHEEPDELTLNLEIDDKLLRDIFNSLYYPDSPYAFSHFPADILGHVYEQFLGKVIELTEGHRAKVVDKPEVKKAGGVYYTPTYIVKYIVEQTVGKLLENKTPKQAASLRILDPACGSGSFLIGAYQHLLDWHLNWYTQNDPVKHAKGSKPALVQAAGGAWKLTVDERKRILLNNIYGVDIDSQAVETTKLSLLLKVLEGETNQTLQPVLKIFHERALPDLGDNIKCGNSLIAPDFYQQPDLPLLTDEDRYRINVFDWYTEFPQVFERKSKASVLQDAAAPLDYNMPGVPLHGKFSYKKTKKVPTTPKARSADFDGGFDAVIGNPPYGALTGDAESRYLREHYESPANSLDTFLLFVELSHRLLKIGGHLGMIIPSGWVSTPSSKSLRDLFLRNFSPSSFVSLPFDVFEAYIDTIIITAQHARIERRNEPDIVLYIFPQRFRITPQTNFLPFRKTARLSDWTGLQNSEFLITCSSVEARLCKKIAMQPAKLEDAVLVKRGIEVFNPSPSPSGLKNPKRALTGTLQRYNLFVGEPGFIAYPDEIEKSKPFDYFSKPRLLLRQVLSRKLRLQGVFTDEAFVTNQSVQSLLLNPKFPDISTLKYLLGLLNSRLLSWYFVTINSAARRDDFPKIIIQQTRGLPIPSFAQSNHAHHSEEIARLVSGLQNLMAVASNLRTPQERL
jgi:type I restriction-modification system DNA methylase subunit